MQESNWRHAAAGSTAGMISVLVNHPLDLIKVRLQVQDGRLKQLPVYSGFTDAVTKTIRVEGLRGLYAGLVPNLVGSTFSWGCYFYCYNRAKKRYQEWQQQQSSPLPPYLNPALHLLSGVEAGTITCLMTNPIWVVKTRLSLQLGGGRPGGMAAAGAIPAPPNSQIPRPYKGMTDALWRIAREEGIRGLYSGFAPSLLLVSHGAIQFMAYEEFKQFFSKMHWTKEQSTFASLWSSGVETAMCSSSTSSTSSTSSSSSSSSNTSTQNSAQGRSTSDTKDLFTSQTRPVTSSAPSERKLWPVEHAAAAVMSKIVASTVTYPPQVVRSRQQQQMDFMDKTQYRSITSTFRNIVRNEGFRGLYKGLVPNTLKVLPASAVTFVVYEAVNNVLQKTTS